MNVYDTCKRKHQQDSKTEQVFLQEWEKEFINIDMSSYNKGEKESVWNQLPFKMTKLKVELEGNARKGMTFP